VCTISQLLLVARDQLLHWKQLEAESQDNLSREMMI
jgi:hypothetical protein